MTYAEFFQSEKKSLPPPPKTKYKICYTRAVAIPVSTVLTNRRSFGRHGFNPYERSIAGSSGRVSGGANLSFLAADLGASSGRVMECRWDGSRFSQIGRAHV